MTEYIYFVIRPNYEDEPFNFFDEAKQFACRCLSNKPIITQVEVVRNDFGECTDSCNLGTIWSWEDLMRDMGDTECSDTIFSKKETFGISENFDDFTIGPQSDEFEYDSEFLALDNIPNNFKMPITEGRYIFDATRAPSESSYIIVSKNPITGRHTYFGRNYRMTTDINKAMSYINKFDAECDVKYAEDCIQPDTPASHTLGGYLGDRFFITTVREARKLQQASETKAQYQARMSSSGSLKTDLDLPSQTEELHINENQKITKTDLYDQLVKNNDFVEIDLGNYTSGTDYVSFGDGGVYSDTSILIETNNGKFVITMWHHSDDGDVSEADDYEFSTSSFEELWDELTSFRPDILVENTKSKLVSRKPIPEDMTIEQLIEEMEANEDMVECIICEGLFDKEDCRKGNGLGYICPNCDASYESDEADYTQTWENLWDSLDEDFIESASLVEDYSYPHFVHDFGPEGAKQEILTQLRADPVTSACVNADGIIPVSLVISANWTASGTQHDGKILDFSVKPNGRISITVEDRSKNVTDKDLEDLLSPPRNGHRLHRTSRCYRLLRTIRDTAENINRERNPGVAVARNRNLTQIFAQDTALAERVKDFVSRIEYLVPKISESEIEGIIQVKVAKGSNAAEDISDEALQKLQDLEDSFKAYPFYNLIKDDKAIVKDRLPSLETITEIEKRKATDPNAPQYHINDTNGFIVANWGIEGTVYFTQPLKDLPKEIKSIILTAQGKPADSQSLDDNNAYGIACIRLANELVNRFGIFWK